MAACEGGEMVPPERVELSSPAPEAGTLSTELQGHYTTKNSMVAEGPTRKRKAPGLFINRGLPRRPISKECRGRLRVLAALDRSHQYRGYP